MRDLAGLPVTERARVVESGDNDGTPYVVTDTLPGGLDLRGWVKAVAAAVTPPASSPGTDSRPFVRAGMWKVPTAGEPRPAAPRAAPPAPLEDMQATAAMERPAPAP